MATRAATRLSNIGPVVAELLCFSSVLSLFFSSFFPSVVVEEVDFVTDEEVDGKLSLDKDSARALAYPDKSSIIFPVAS